MYRQDLLATFHYARTSKRSKRKLLEQWNDLVRSHALPMFRLVFHLAPFFFLSLSLFLRHRNLCGIGRILFRIVIWWKVGEQGITWVLSWIMGLYVKKRKSTFTSMHSFFIDNCILVQTFSITYYPHPYQFLKSNNHKSKTNIFYHYCFL